ARKSGKDWMMKCPAHDDRRASLSISEGRGGRVLLKCFAGCTFDQIVAAAGLTTEDLFPESAHRQRDNGAGSTPTVASGSASKKVFDWSKCVAAFTDQHVEQVAEWRAYSPEFVRELRERGQIGIYDRFVAFPVHNNGKIVGTHYRLKNGDWN